MIIQIIFPKKSSTYFNTIKPAYSSIIITIAQQMSELIIIIDEEYFWITESYFPQNKAQKKRRAKSARPLIYIME